MTHPANPLLLLNEVKKEKGGMEIKIESTKTRRSSGTSEERNL